MITYQYRINMTPGGIPVRCRLGQYDDDWSIVFTLYSDSGEFTVESGTTAKIRGTKKDGLGYSANATINISNKTVTVAGDKQITAVAGENIFELVLLKGTKELSTANVVFFVERAAMDAGTLVSDSQVQEILDMSADVIAASENVSTLRGNFAPAYSSSATYALGDYVIYDNQLYRCKTAITTGESWHSSKWVSVDVATEQKNKLSVKAVDCPEVPENTDLDTLTTAGSHKISSGTRMGTMTHKPASVAGKIIVLETTATSRLYQVFLPSSATNHIATRFYNGTSWSAWLDIPYSGDIPTNVLSYASQTLTDEQKAQARTNINAVKDTDTLIIDASKISTIANGTDLDTLTTAGNYKITSSSAAQSMSNVPLTSAGARVLVMSTIATSRLYQIWFESSANMRIYTRFYNGSAWSDWVQLGSGGSSGNTYVTNQYQNTYNITTSPSITTDTNGWLQATGDTTDMTGAIMSMLTDTGYCHLGEGTFYVSGGIDLPEGACIEGCGQATKVMLLSSVDSGYVFGIKRHNTIRNLHIMGAASTITSFSENVGTRTGIYYVGNYDGTGGNDTTEGVGCRIDNLSISNFTGYGIVCRNIGLSVYRGLLVSQCWIYACHTGICLDYYAEFNKVLNVCISRCYIAARNDGGNNGFENCIFHATHAGFVMDNSNDDKPNNAHGYMVGCTFCHIGNNTGIAILIDSITAGFVFTGLQVHFNTINIYDSGGIQFNNVQFGKGVPATSGGTIVIDGGETIVFNGCMFMHDDTLPPSITVTNNSKVKFVNCFGSATGNAITA